MQESPISTASLKFFLFALTGLIFLAGVHAHAQTLSGKTANALTKLPVAYVSIGIKHKPVGTVSDSLGRYHLSYGEAEVSKADSVFFSAVGYETVKLSFEAFLNGDKEIYLKESAQELKTVQVSAIPRKMKSYGRWSANLVFFPAMYKTIPRYSDEKGREQATIMKIDEDVFLRKLNFRISRRSFKQLKLRMNIYGVKDGMPDQSLLLHDIVFDVAGSSAIGMPSTESIDLVPYQIRLSGRKEIAVSLAILDLQPLPGDTSRQAFYIPSFPSPLRSSFYRMKSEASWQKVSSSYLLLGLEVSTSKASKANEEEYQAEIINANPELSEALYGNNSGKRIAVSDGEIYYETYGKGRPLILLHGNNEGINSFRKQIGPLSAHYQVIAVDSRGQGNSINRKKTPYSYQLFAADLLTLMDSLRIKQASVIGWSDGGNTALEFVLKHPERMDKMVLMGANLFPGTDAIKEDVVRLFEKRRDILMNLQDAEAQNLLRLTQLVLQEPHIQLNELDSIGIPTMILAGAADVVKAAHTRLIHAHIKGSKLNIVADSDHYLLLKKPKVFNEIVLDFLGR
ncbi:alpha/beta fold hydrolase [Pedobacter aquatilis]|uniref:alpha/beta fold hydrolase n=1 Tax=Pedobacter aquatilis TaxID=351343 RepID=UPI00292DEAE1|nr:alpha/beta fold hydrolase [Pedobacter aquatilis]